MGMTLTEKILARAAGVDECRPGDILTCKVDLAMANDVTAPLAIDAMRQIGVENVWNREKVAMVQSHFVPAKDIASAKQSKIMREFAREQELPFYFEIGRGGIEHALLPQEGLVGPGDVVIGADSHTCTYGALGCFSTGVGSTDLGAVLATGDIWLRVPESIRVVFTGKLRPFVTGKDLILHLIGVIGDDGARYQALEIVGDTIEQLSVEARLTMTNMAIEAGAKNGVMAPDAKVREYMAARPHQREWVYMQPDPDARYVRELEIDASQIRPTVSRPSLPSRTAAAADVAGKPIDQVFIGSCTNARIEDLRIVAGIFEGRSVHPRVRCIVMPASTKVQQQALDEGILQQLAEAGCEIGPASCGPCLGGYMGVLAPGEVAVSTSNRNFPGRMGDRDAEVYLASPATAATSAILGRVADPSELMQPEKEAVLV